MTRRDEDCAITRPRGAGLSAAQNHLVFEIGAVSEPDWIRMDEDGLFGLLGPMFHQRTTPTVGRFWFETDAKHRNRGGFVHGGLIVALADRAMGATARHGDPERRHATVQLDVHFVRAARIGLTLNLECRVVREARSLVFMDSVVSAEGNDIATARGVWKILSRRDS